MINMCFFDPISYSDAQSIDIRGYSIETVSYTHLGDVYTGVFSNCDEYYDEFVQALQISDEKGWRLPLDSEYFEKLKSTSADFKNSAGKPGGGASVAANFLEAFIEEGTQWLHLDIAGSADNDGTGATGAMIRSVVNMINLKTIVKK